MAFSNFSSRTMINAKTKRNTTKPRGRCLCASYMKRTTSISILSSSSAISFTPRLPPLGSIFPQATIGIMRMLGAAIHHATTHLVPTLAAHHVPLLGHINLTANQQVTRLAAYGACFLSNGRICPSFSLSASQRFLAFLAALRVARGSSGCASTSWPSSLLAFSSLLELSSLVLFRWANSKDLVEQVDTLLFSPVDCDLISCCFPSSSSSSVADKRAINNVNDKSAVVSTHEWLVPCKAELSLNTLLLSA